jgi:hypothetical protein
MRFRMLSMIKRTATALIVVVPISLIPASGAAAAGYATHLSKRTVHAAEPKAPLKGTPRGYIQLLAKTNLHGQVATVISLNIENVPISCTTGNNKTVGTESFVSNEVQTSVHSSGAFSYGFPLLSTPLTFKVAGKITGHGTHVSGDVTVTASTPEFDYGPSQGCHLVAPTMSWSANLKWRKF